MKTFKNIYNKGISNNMINNLVIPGFKKDFEKEEMTTMLI